MSYLFVSSYKTRSERDVPIERLRSEEGTTNVLI